MAIGVGVVMRALDAGPFFLRRLASTSERRTARAL
jgi:hypothetical protein